MPSPRLLLAFLGACVALQPVAAPAAAQRPRDQDMAYKDAQRGKIMPLPRIEQRVRDNPALRGATYLGPEFNQETATYRLKFVRAGRVIWVDVDARDGRVLQTSGD